MKTLLIATAAFLVLAQPAKANQLQDTGMCPKVIQARVMIQANLERMQVPSGYKAPSDVTSKDRDAIRKLYYKGKALANKTNTGIKTNLLSDDYVDVHMEAVELFLRLEFVCLE